MWTADNWKDYEVIDTCGGEKLERWGQYILVRPDPQVIWNTPKTDKHWKKMNTVVKGKKVGRNDPCPCGSGKKYKYCCGR